MCKPLNNKAEYWRIVLRYLAAEQIARSAAAIAYGEH